MFTFFHRKYLIPLLVILILSTLGFSFLAREGKVFAAPSVSPALLLSKNAGPPTSILKVTGTSFGANETVVILFDSTQIGSASTDSSGSFATHIPVPASALPGLHVIKATGNSSHLSAKAYFHVRTNWVMSGFGPQQDDANPYENVVNSSNVSSMVQGWSQAVAGGTDEATPVIANNIVYEGMAGSSSDHFYAFNATTGQALWSYPLHVGSDAAVANDTVYVGSDQLYAFAAKTGKLRWTAAAGNSFLSSPVVVGGTVFVGSENEGLYAFNATNGTLLWSETTKGPIAGAPAVAGGIVYVCSVDTLYAFNEQSGQALWTAQIGNGISTSPAVANGIIYTSATSGSLVALNAKSGTVLWTASINDPGEGDAYPPAVANGAVYVAGIDLYAFNALTGSQIWSQPMSDVPADPPTIANGIIYQSEGFGPGGFSAIDAATGKTLWGTGQNELSYSSPIVVNGILYVGAAKTYPNGGGYLFTYHLPSGPA